MSESGNLSWLMVYTNNQPCVGERERERVTVSIVPPEGKISCLGP